MKKKRKRRGGIEFAQRWKPRGLKKMKLKLSKESMGLLNWMIRAPGMLAGNLRTVAEKIQPYKAPDEIGAREVRKITMWLEKKIGDKPPQPFEGRIEECYVKRMEAVAKHFEELGRMSYIVGEYMDLVDELAGKEMDEGGIEEKDEGGIEVKEAGEAAPAEPFVPGFPDLTEVAKADKPGG